MVHNPSMDYSISQLAKLAGVSVRTLHHYDDVGLLKPSHVKPNGYRCYEEPELIKLQQILFFKELEFSLEQIKAMMEAPGFDVAEALNDQRRLLEMKRERLDRLLSTIDRTIVDVKEGNEMTAGELYGSFTREQIEEYKKEVREKWGSKELEQSEERTRHWTPADYARVQEEGAAILRKIVPLMDKGPADAAVQEQIEKYFQQICKFYDCTLEIFRGLGEMYVSDERFAAYFRNFDDGLPAFMRDAMAVYCDEGEKR